MLIGFNKEYNNYQNIYHKTNTNKKISFGIRPQEQLVNLLACENLNKFKMTFDEAVRIYQMLGYKITRNTGSHAHIHINGLEQNIPLVDPHNGKKHLPIFDLKRMVLILTGRAKEAMFVR